jgi:hypothetical protein
MKVLRIALLVIAYALARGQDLPQIINIDLTQETPEIEFDKPLINDEFQVSDDVFVLERKDKNVYEVTLPDFAQIRNLLQLPILEPGVQVPVKLGDNTTLPGFDLSKDKTIEIAGQLIGIEERDGSFLFYLPPDSPVGTLEAKLGNITFGIGLKS